MAWGVGWFAKPYFYKYFTTDVLMGGYFNLSYGFYINGMMFADFFQTILGTILRSSGDQNYASSLMIVVFYVVGVPASIFMVGVYEMKGSWMAMFVCYWILCLLYFWKVNKIDWNL